MGIALHRGRMNFKNISKLMSLVIAVAAYFCSPVFAESGKQTIVVSATVVARVSQSVIRQVSRFSVTQEDIRRGFVEISSGTILQIKTNSRNGYMLYFEGENEIFKEVSVVDRGRTTVLSPNGGFVHQTASPGNVEIKDLSYRLLLREDIQPGTYPFPFRVKASLL
jgi:hypothetical protein